MSLQSGARKIGAHQGNFGQSRASRWSEFSGILQDEPFMEGMRLYRRSRAGKSQMPKSLQKTMAGYKHKGGMSEERKQELKDLRKTVEAQNEKILELESKVPEPAKPIEPPSEPVPQIDEGTFEEPGT